MILCVRYFFLCVRCFIKWCGVSKMIENVSVSVICCCVVLCCVVCIVLRCVALISKQIIYARNEEEKHFNEMIFTFYILCVLFNLFSQILSSSLPLRHLYSFIFSAFIHLFYLIFSSSSLYFVLSYLAISVLCSHVISSLFLYLSLTEHQQWLPPLACPSNFKKLKNTKVL